MRSILLSRRGVCQALATALTAFVVPPALAQQGDERRIAHSLGMTAVSGKPVRIVALEFSFVQALDELGQEPVGIADDNQPNRIAQLLGREIAYQSVGTRLEPNLELVSTLAPDLIIADEIRHGAVYAQLSAIAPTIVLNSWEGSYQTIKESLVTIADALGDKARGEAVLAAHEARMKALAAEIPAGDKRRFLLAVATPDSMALHTSSSFSGSVFKTIGLTPAIESDAPIETGASLERLIVVNPDVLLVATETAGTVLDQWKTNSAFSAIAAEKDEKVFQVDRNQFSRFRGLKTAELIASEILAKVFHAG